MEALQILGVRVAGPFVVVALGVDIVGACERVVAYSLADGMSTALDVHGDELWIATAPQRAEVAVGSPTSLSVHDVASGRRIDAFPGNYPADSGAFHAQRIAACGYDRLLIVDRPSGACRTLDATPRGDAEAMAFDETGRELVVARFGAGIDAWNAMDGSFLGASSEPNVEWVCGAGPHRVAVASRTRTRLLSFAGGQFTQQASDVGGPIGWEPRDGRIWSLSTGRARVIDRFEPG